MAKPENNPFSTPEGILEVLWRDGYHAAAELIEQMRGTRDAEWKYLKQFVRENNFNRTLPCNQLRSLWTAYCFHHELIVDTSGYDNDLLELWNFMVNCGYPVSLWWANYDTFTNFMSEYLV